MDSLPVRPKQQWREVVGDGAQIIVVDSIEDRTVHGHAFPEGQPTILSVAVRAAADFASMTLVSDPEWPTHRVVMCASVDNQDVIRAMLSVGQWEGGHAMSLTEDGGPRQWFSVVAPSEADAVNRARAAVDGLQVVESESIHVDNGYPRN